MKRIICAVMLLVVASATFAQDNVVKKARVKMEEAQDLAAQQDRKPADEQKLQQLISSTLEMIEPTLTSPETKKQLANAWDVKAKLLMFKVNGYISQLQAGETIDAVAFRDLVLDGLHAMEECYKLELASGVIAKHQKDSEVTCYSVKNKLFALNCRQFLAYCGQQFFGDQKYADAEDAFVRWMSYPETYTIVAQETALEGDAQVPQMAFFTCLCAYNAKDYATIAKYIELARQYDEQKAQAHQLFLASLIEQGDTARWLDEGKKVVLTDPDNGEGTAQNILAYYFSNNRTDEATAFTNSILEADPASRIGNYAMGTILMNDRKFEKAIPFFDKAIEADPEFSDAIYNAGVCYCDWGYDINEALSGKKMTQAQYDAAVAPVKECYRKAEPYFLKVRELEPDNVRKWASRLRTVYSVLDKKAEYKEMDTLLGDE